MGTILTDISIVVVAIVVLALVLYLLMIINHLRKANRNLYQLAAGLEQIANHTQPLPEKLNTINKALEQLLNGLLSVNGHLAAVVEILKG